MLGALVTLSSPFGALRLQAVLLYSTLGRAVIQYLDLSSQCTKPTLYCTVARRLVARPLGKGGAPWAAQFFDVVQLVKIRNTLLEGAQAGPGEGTQPRA